MYIPRWLSTMLTYRNPDFHARSTPSIVKKTIDLEIEYLEARLSALESLHQRKDTHV